MFPDEEISKIFDQYEIQKCFLDQNLTETDSTSIFLILICKISCSINEKDVRDIIFEVLAKSKILQRLDLSDDLTFKIN